MVSPRLLPALICPVTWTDSKDSDATSCLRHGGPAGAPRTSFPGPQDGNATSGVTPAQQLWLQSPRQGSLAPCRLGSEGTGRVSNLGSSQFSKLVETPDLNLARPKPRTSPFPTATPPCALWAGQARPEVQRGGTLRQEGDMWMASRTHPAHTPLSHQSSDSEQHRVTESSQLWSLSRARGHTYPITGKVYIASWDLGLRSSCLRYHI